MPSQIPQIEYELLKHELSLESIDLKFSYKYFDKLIQLENILEDCYELDTNEIPPKYRLKNLDRLFPNINIKVLILKFILFNFKINFLKENEFKKLWNSLEKILSNTLKKAAKICYDNEVLTKSEYERYFVSSKLTKLLKKLIYFI